MIIQFGLTLEDRVFPASPQGPDAATLTCGVNGFIAWLEKHLGLRFPEYHDYLRIEQYRQALELYASTNKGAFYVQSFDADSMGTAKAMLERRDELLLAGWDFQLNTAMPARLKDFAAIENMLKTAESLVLYEGFAERFVRVVQLLPDFPIPLTKVCLNEPYAILPKYLKVLFSQLRAIDVVVQEPENKLSDTAEDTDLAYFRKRLLKQTANKASLKKDGSIILLKSKRETYAAAFLAHLFKDNPAYRPLCLIPDKNRALDNCLVENGLPSMGILSASLARPTLQILKLVSTFLWKPVDPYKILQFVTLPTIPLHPYLARSIAKVMAEKPGIYSSDWNRMVRQFFEYYETKAEENPEQKEYYEKEKEAAQQEYVFWFNRKRYDSAKNAPKKEVVALFRYVLRWAGKQLEENIKAIDRIQQKIENPATTFKDFQKYSQDVADLVNQQPAIESLRNQTDNLLEILHALPEGDDYITSLRLDRMVRTVNEPASVRFRSAEKGHLPYIHQPSAVTAPVSSMLWWNFVDMERKTGFNKWYPKELEYLNAMQIELDMSFDDNAIMLWQRIQPFVKTQERMVLVIPESVDGKEQIAHPLWGDLCAAFGEHELQQICLNLENKSNVEYLAQFYKLPAYLGLESVILAQPKAYLELSNTQAKLSVQTESYTSLDALLYYPYQWLFNYQAKFRKSAMLSVARDRRLMGNLAHSLFQQLFLSIIEEQRHWTKKELSTWIDQNIQALFDKEGAVLLMYGKEPERVGFIKKIKTAAWTLLSAIQNNGWKIIETELRVEGQMAEQQIKGFVDLVLARGQERAVVDLKWGGYSFRKEQLKNNTDLQLVIYSKLLGTPTKWAHTAYFIIEKAKIIARNNLAFEEAESVGDIDDYQSVHETIWDSIIKTYFWRMQQIKEGKIEVRTQETFEELEALLEEEDNAFDLLEMKRDAAKFDDYKVLINRIK